MLRGVLAGRVSQALSWGSVRTGCHFALPMEPSGVWKNLISGKQAVPTVACPSCGAQVSEFRIHSHLDSCLKTLTSKEETVVAAAGENAHELSDGEQNRRRRGRARGPGRGRGRGRKRREGAQIKKGHDGDTEERKRAREEDNVEEGKGLIAPADEDDANFYQHWEYSVSVLDEFAKARKAGRLSDPQKQELSASGVLTIERHEVSAMVLELDRLLADTDDTAGFLSSSLPRFRNGNGFHVPALNQVGVPEQVNRSPARIKTAVAEGHVDTQSEQSRALEAWWEQWVTVEWPEGPLPSGFHSSLPQRSRAAQDVHIATEKVGIERAAAEELTVLNAHHLAPMSTRSFNESGGVIGGGNAVVMPHLDVNTTELLTESDRNDIIEVDMKSKLKIGGETNSTAVTSAVPQGLATRGDQLIQTKLISYSEPATEHSDVAESSVRKAGPPSPSTEPANNLADTSGTSPGLQACPICNVSFPPNSSNSDVNKHIDECLSGMAGLLD